MGWDEDNAKKRRLFLFTLNTSVLFIFAQEGDWACWPLDPAMDNVFVYFQFILSVITRRSKFYDKFYTCSLIPYGKNCFIFVKIFLEGGQ